MKTCKYCHWYYDVRVEVEKERRAAHFKGFCSVSCGIAWDAEKEYTLRKEQERGQL